MESGSHQESNTVLNYDRDHVPKKGYLLGNQACVKQKWQGES